MANFSKPLLKNVPTIFSQENSVVAYAKQAFVHITICTCKCTLEALFENMVQKGSNKNCCSRTYQRAFQSLSSSI